MEKYTVTVEIEEFINDDKVECFNRIVKIDDKQVYSDIMKKSELPTNDLNLTKFHRWIDYKLHPEKLNEPGISSIDDNPDDDNELELDW